MGRNVLHESSGSQAGPLTYSGYMAHVLEEFERTGNVRMVRVQVRKKGIVLCGRVLEASPAAPGGDCDWFKVDCYLGQLWFADKNVRLCSGDGLCMCEPATDGAGGARERDTAATAGAVPLGNTGTTLGARA